MNLNKIELNEESNLVVVNAINYIIINYWDLSSINKMKHAIIGLLNKNKMKAFSIDYKISKNPTKHKQVPKNYLS